jgi:hypothetical protein
MTDERRSTRVDLVRLCSAKDQIGSLLSLSCGHDDQVLVIGQTFQPAGDVRGTLIDRARRDADFIATKRGEVAAPPFSRRWGVETTEAKYPVSALGVNQPSS